MTELVELKLDRDVYEELARRVSGSPISVESYVNALLIAQMVAFLNQEREDKRRWDARNAEFDSLKADTSGDKA